MTFKSIPLLFVCGLATSAASGAVGRSLRHAQVSAGGFHTLALVEDGTVRSWGANGRGQLGVGPLEDRFLGGPGHWEHRVMTVQSPVFVKAADGETDFSGVIAVAAGYRFSAALSEDGSVRTWGLNERGQLGLGRTGEITLPTLVQVVDGSGALEGITAIAVGYNHMAALHADGTVYAWGNNAFGQLGEGTRKDRFAPVRVRVRGAGGDALLTGITAIAAGHHFTLALHADGTVLTWGIAETPRPGATEIAWNATPVRVKGTDGRNALDGIRAIAAGQHHALALRADGTLLAWGGNAHGQLGTGSAEDRRTPAPVKGVRGESDVLSGMIAMAAGSRHSLALSADGTVFAWGCNLHGQLGVGGRDDTVADVPVAVAAGAEFGQSEIVALSAGHHHSAALSRDGSVWTWGGNRDGQLGDGTATGSRTPSRIAPLKVASEAATGKVANLQISYNPNTP